MTFRLTEDFKTLDELRESPEGVLRQVQKNEQPVVITVKGKPAAVVIGADQYQWMVHLLDLGRALAEGEASIRAGKVRPVEAFFKELLGKSKRAKKVSG